CAVQSSGELDMMHSKHLVLWDLKLVVDFPHSAVILLLSATITHLNVPVHANKMGVSFTQYIAGGLMRYINNGFCMEGQVAEEDKEEFTCLIQVKSTWWEMGLRLFSTIDELLESIPEE
ncbi:hypothetical protein B0H17DRAFT_920839, partial [Mycena rosella]